MKKFVSLFLALLTVLSLVACGSKTDTKTGDGVKSAGTADSFPMASMAAALVLSAGALAVLTVRGRRKEQDAQ